MKILTRLDHKSRQLRSYITGLLILAVIVISPFSAQAGILQETFGEGYGFLHTPPISRTPDSAKRAESSTKSTAFNQMFEKGYSLFDKEPITFPMIASALRNFDEKSRLSGIPLSEQRISAFHSLWRKGYEIVIHSPKLKLQNWIYCDIHHKGG